MSILNDKNVEVKEQKLFLGPGLALQRYDKFKHPVFFDLFKRQLEFFWRPEEISLIKDRVDYDTLEDHEKHIFTSNLLFQTMMDSVVARGVPSLGKYVTSPELEACINAWQLFETIHSYSYTYIIKNLYPNPGEILDKALENEEIVKRANSVKEHYDKLLSLPENASEKEIKRQIYLTLISVNILEAVRFYVSFVCAFAFAENKKMIGNADIIRLIKKDEACLSEDTQVLTNNGWKFIKNINEDDLVAQYNKDKTIEFIKPTGTIKKKHDSGYNRIHNKLCHVDMILTDNHRVIYETQSGEIKETTASKYKCNHLSKIPVSGLLKDNERKLTSHERFLIALQADGTIDDRSECPGSISGNRRVAFTFKKDRKIDRLRKLLNELNYEYSISEDSRSRKIFYVHVPLENPVYKTFKEWNIQYGSISGDWCKEFIEEMVNWDGSIKTKLDDGDTYYYSSKIESNTEIVQTIASLCGYKTYKSKQIDNRKSTFSDMHRLTIQKSKDSISGQSLINDKAEYSGDVYCISVPSGMFLAKRNDGIFVTGNCHLFITQSIIDILRKDESEGFQSIIKECEKEATQMFLDAVNEEKAWAEYLFSNGSILGLNEKILSQYIEWLADSRMSSIGLPKLFNVKNAGIGSWLTPWMESIGVQVAPQESEITSYKIGASTNDISTLDITDFEL